MSLSSQVFGNIKTLTGPLVYIVADTDGTLNVDTTLGIVSIQLPNIKNSGLLLSPRCININDIGNNAQTNPIVILPTGGDSVNSLPSVSISTNKGSVKCSIINYNEWMVSGPGLTPISLNDKNFVMQQIIPSNTWVVNHGLAKKCCVQIVDNTNKEIEGEIEWNSNNQVTIYFNSNETGSVFCN